ncbi:MAG: GYDIA family GHMP kinase [Chitinophagales bacterium]|nr:GYDIA family GHMP kinase [Chitinophagales bacterium]
MALRISNTHDEWHYYGHGKLLITAEYFVLDGALALAVPTRYGQHLRVKALSAHDGLLYWVALNHQGKPWLQLVIDTENLQCINTESDIAERLVNILRKARELNPLFLINGRNHAVETALEFPNEWGLGSSSTLIHCLAQWAGVDGYTLLRETIGGSGYDVACAAHHAPILYQLVDGAPIVRQITWQPPFCDQLYFVYLGKKKLSSEAIRYYREQGSPDTDTLQHLSSLTLKISWAQSLDEFEELINEHENFIAGHLNMPKVKDVHFNDHTGSVKSLGAWGGDFVLLTARQEPAHIKEYLKNKGFDTVWSWKELILPFSTTKNN